VLYGEISLDLDLITKGGAYNSLIDRVVDHTELWTCIGLQSRKFGSMSVILTAIQK